MFKVHLQMECALNRDCNACTLFDLIVERVGQCTRRGGPDQLKLKRFTQALYDPNTHLTYPAITGQRKQSIRDVEILFSEEVEKFMEGEQYTYEAKYIRAISSLEACV